MQFGAMFFFVLLIVRAHTTRDTPPPPSSRFFVLFLFLFLFLARTGSLSLGSTIKLCPSQSLIYWFHNHHTTPQGSIYWKMDTGPTGLQNRVGAFFLLVRAWGWLGVWGGYVGIWLFLSSP